MPKLSVILSAKLYNIAIENNRDGDKFTGLQKILLETSIFLYQIIHSILSTEGMPERSNGPGLGPGSLCLRGFESSFPHARVTQPGLECFPPKEEVAGSNPVVSVLINS